MGKPTMLFMNWSNTNRSVQLQKMARILTFWILEEEGLYYLCSGNSVTVTEKLVCVFVFTYADCWFSHEMAQLISIPVLAS